MNLTLRKMLHNVSALTDLATEISSTHNFEEVTRASLHTLLGALAIPRGAIARYTAKPRQLKITAAKGLAGAVGQRFTLVRDDVEQIAVMRDDHHAALIGADQVFEKRLAGEIQVIVRFVKQQQVGLDNKELGES